MAVKLVTDSICAPSLQTAETLDITIVPINIHFGERIYQDLFEIEPERFYSELVSAPELPTTSIPSVERYFNVKAVDEINHFIIVRALPIDPAAARADPVLISFFLDSGRYRFFYIFKRSLFE